MSFSFTDSKMNLDEIAVELLEKVLEKEGEMRISASGWSMVPVIFPGDWVWVRKCSPGEVKNGDIVLLKEKERFLLHRVWRILDSSKNPSSPQFVTKGDARFVLDLPFEVSEVMGKVVRCGKGPARRFLWRILNQVMKFLSITYVRIKDWWQARNVRNRGTI